MAVGKCTVGVMFIAAGVNTQDVNREAAWEIEEFEEIVVAGKMVLGTEYVLTKSDARGARRTVRGVLVFEEGVFDRRTELGVLELDEVVSERK